VSDATTAPQPGRTRAPRWALLIAAGVIALAILSAALALPGLRDSRDVASLLASSASLDSVEATAELCTRDLPCVEAYRTEVGDFLRFASSGEAEHWATALGDEGRRSGATVLNLRDVELSAEQERLAIDTLFSREDGS
jgi:hypothetical protein